MRRQLLPILALLLAGCGSSIWAKGHPERGMDVTVQSTPITPGVTLTGVQEYIKVPGSDARGLSGVVEQSTADEDDLFHRLLVEVRDDEDETADARAAAAFLLDHLFEEVEEEPETDADAPPDNP